VRWEIAFPVLLSTYELPPARSPRNSPTRKNSPTTTRWRSSEAFIAPSSSLRSDLSTNRLLWLSASARAVRFAARAAATSARAVCGQVSAHVTPYDRQNRHTKCIRKSGPSLNHFTNLKALSKIE